VPTEAGRCHRPPWRFRTADVDWGLTLARLLAPGCPVAQGAALDPPTQDTSSQESQLPLSLIETALARATGRAAGAALVTVLAVVLAACTELVAGGAQRRQWPARQRSA